jgi:hypothetical protein
MEELNNSRINNTSLNTGSKFEDMAANPYLWRSY